MTKKANKQPKMENVEPKVVEEKEIEVAEKPQKDNGICVQSLNIHELYDYISSCEVLLRHYENQVMVDKGVNELAYVQSRKIYDKYREIHDIIFKEIGKRVELIHA